MRRRVRPRVARGLTALLAVLATGGIAACGGTSTAGGQGGGGASLRLGYLANLTHAPALVGVARGILARDLGPAVSLRTQTFNAGPAAVEALFAGALDAAYVGPSAAINAFTQSHGDAVRIVSGATSGGAALVVRAGSAITEPSDLRGRLLVTPQLGNTQDVALRAWLRDHGLRTDPEGGGDVRIAPTDNATALQLFEQGRIDGAWEPEPWASRMVVEGHGTVLVDEAGLWPGGRFATTELVVTTRLLQEHPDQVRALVRGNLDTLAWMGANPDAARQAAADALAALNGRALRSDVLHLAWSHLTFTSDQLDAALAMNAQQAQEVGLVRSAELHGLLDLRILDAVLHSAGLPVVDGAGLQAA